MKLEKIVKKGLLLTALIAGTIGITGCVECYGPSGGYHLISRTYHPIVVGPQPVIRTYHPIVVGPYHQGHRKPFPNHHHRRH